jgi:dTDP-4-dehydrorhamnose 3,5-epimerase
MTQPIKDRQTVTACGESTRAVPAGVTFHDVITQTDDRGTVVELYDPRWGWHAAPLVFSYCFTIRPGVTKGWAVHEKHEDRYFILFGETQVVLYDERPDSPTRGLVAEVVLSEYRRRLMNIPAGVWHAERNIGGKDVVVINFPTVPDDHASPDKYRLPLDTARIPYRFENTRGW